MKPTVSEKAVILAVQEAIFTPRLQYRIAFPVECPMGLSALGARFRPFREKIKTFFRSQCGDSYHFNIQEYSSRRGDEANYVFQIDLYGCKSVYADLQKEVETWEY